MLCLLPVCCCRRPCTLLQEFCDAGTLSKVAACWQPAEEGEAQMLQRLLLLQDVARGLK